MVEPIIASKETIKQVFDAAAATYDRAGTPVFEIAGTRLVELLEIPTGARILDVATGVGAVLLPTARRVGSRGRVIGVDLAPGMIEQARTQAARHGLLNVDLREMDAERCDFADDAFDAVVCGFALFFMPSMENSLREMRRVCKPGARVGVTVWGEKPFDPAWKIFAEQVRAYGVEVRMPQKVAYKEEEMRALMAAADWSEIETRVETMDAVYPTEDDWWAFQLTTGARAAIERMDDATRARFRAEYFAKLRPLKRADGAFHFPAPAMYAVARKE